MIFNEIANKMIGYILFSILVVLGGLISFMVVRKILEAVMA